MKQPSSDSHTIILKRPNGKWIAFLIFLYAHIPVTFFLIVGDGITGEGLGAMACFWALFTLWSKNFLRMNLSLSDEVLTVYDPVRSKSYCVQLKDVQKIKVTNWGAWADTYHLIDANGKVLASFPDVYHDQHKVLAKIQEKIDRFGSRMT